MIHLVPLLSSLSTVSFVLLFLPCFEFFSKCFYNSKFSYSYNDLISFFNFAEWEALSIISCIPLFLVPIVAIGCIYYKHMNEIKSSLKDFSAKDLLTSDVPEGYTVCQN